MPFLLALHKTLHLSFTVKSGGLLAYGIEIWNYQHSIGYRLFPVFLVLWKVVLLADFRSKLPFYTF